MPCVSSRSDHAEILLEEGNFPVLSLSVLLAYPFVDEVACLVLLVPYQKTDRDILLWVVESCKKQQKIVKHVHCIFQRGKDEDVEVVDVFSPVGSRAGGLVEIIQLQGGFPFGCASSGCGAGKINRRRCFPEICALSGVVWLFLRSVLQCIRRGGRREEG